MSVQRFRYMTVSQAEVEAHIEFGLSGSIGEGPLVELDVPLVNDTDLENLQDLLVPFGFVYEGPTPTTALPNYRQVYDAVVAADGSADFSLISAAFEAGATSVFVRPDTYVEAADIVIPAGGVLEGGGTPGPGGGVVVVLAAGHQLVLDGSARKETTGTVSIASGSTTVTGVGTLFSNLANGDSILLGGTFFRIGSITNDLSLELGVYRGRTISAQPMLGQSMLDSVKVENLVLALAPAEAVVMRQASNISMRRVFASLSGATGQAWLIEDSAAVILRTCAAADNNGHGFRGVGSRSIRYLSCAALNNDGDGYRFETSEECLVKASSASLNAGVGCSGVTSTEIGVFSTTTHGNAGAGIVAGGGSRIVGNTVRDNGGDGIVVPFGSDDAIVSANRSTGNTGAGANIQVGVLRALVAANNLRGNVGASFTDNGTGTVGAGSNVV